MFDRVVGLTHLNLNRMALGSETWGQQFRTAMTVNGGDIENASSMDYFMHFVTFPWKVSPQKGIVFLARLSYCSILYQTGQRSSSFYVGYFSSSSPPSYPQHFVLCSIRTVLFFHRLSLPFVHLVRGLVDGWHSLLPWQ